MAKTILVPDAGKAGVFTVDVKIKPRSQAGNFSSLAKKLQKMGVVCEPKTSIKSRKR